MWGGWSRPPEPAEPSPDGAAGEARVGLVDPAAARRLHLRTAAVAAVLTAGLAVATAYGRGGVLVGIAAVQALLVPAYVLGTRRPGRLGAMLLGLAAAGAADTVLVVRDRTSLAVLVGVLALAFPAMLLHQLARGVVRVAVTESLGGVALLVTAEVGLSCCVALARATDGGRLVAALVLGAGAGLVVARLVDAAVPAPRIADDVPHGLLGVVAATAAGAAASAAVGVGATQLTPARGALLGAVVAAVAALVAVGVGFVVATAEPEPGRRDRLSPAYHACLGVALPLALAAPVGYLVALSVAG